MASLVVYSYNGAGKVFDNATNEVNAMIEENVLPFKLEVSEELLTPHAGLVLAHEFHVGLGVGRLLDAKLPRPRSGRGHRPSEVVLPTLLMLLGGGRDLVDIEVIAKDRALREAARLRRVPAPSTLGDWLRRTGKSRHTMNGLARVQDELTCARLGRDARTEFTLDVDATIIEAEKQEATRAYDGTKGFQPMLGFLFENRWLVHEEFRTGSASPSGGAVRFIKACQRRMPKGTRIARLRSDSAFYNAAVVEHCEAEGIQYVIGAPWDPAVKAAYRTIPKDGWTEFETSSGRRRETAETVHAFNKSEATFRLVFVRDVEEQKTLFGNEPRGRALITNIAPEQKTAAEVVEWYNQRGTAENYIKELKHGFGMLHLPCGQEHANAAWFRIGAMAYNLFLMQQAFGLPPELANATVGTVRWRLYQVAARLVRHARQLILKVAADAATFAMLSDLRFASQSMAFP